MTRPAEDLEAAEAEIGAGPSLLALAHAYRRHALAGPHLYRLSHSRPLARTALPEELDGRFPPGADLDATWRTGCETFAQRQLTVGAEP